MTKCKLADRELVFQELVTASLTKPHEHLARNCRQDTQNGSGSRAQSFMLGSGISISAPRYFIARAVITNKKARPTARCFGLRYSFGRALGMNGIICCMATASSDAPSRRADS